MSHITDVIEPFRPGEVLRVRELNILAAVANEAAWLMALDEVRRDARAQVAAMAARLGLA